MNGIVLFQRATLSSYQLEECGSNAAGFAGPNFQWQALQMEQTDRVHGNFQRLRCAMAHVLPGKDLGQ